MRLAIPLATLVLLGGCAASAMSPAAQTGALSRSCAEQYRVCTRSAGDEGYCDDQRDACKADTAATREATSEKQRRYEEFKKKRGE